MLQFACYSSIDSSTCATTPYHGIVHPSVNPSLPPSLLLREFRTKPATIPRAVHATAAYTTAACQHYDLKYVERSHDETADASREKGCACASSGQHKTNHHRKPRSSPFFFALRISSPRTFWGAPTHRQYSVMTCECNAIAWRSCKIAHGPKHTYGGGQAACPLDASSARRQCCGFG